MAGIGGSPGVSTPGLPSWVPDWTTRRYNSITPGVWEWRACGDTEQQNEYRFIPSSPGILVASGFLVDIIITVFSVSNGIEESRLLKLLVQVSVSNVKAMPYIYGGKTRLQAYFYVLFCGPCEEPGQFNEIKAAFLYKLWKGIDTVCDG